MVKEKKLENDVFFEGKLDSMKEFYNKIDCFLLFSKTEDLPMVIIEAFSAGLPVISTNVGGVSELIYPNVGLMIDKDLSIESQMDTISKFIIRLDKLEARNKNIKFARTFFDNRVHKNKLEGFYNKI